MGGLWMIELAPASNVTLMSVCAMVCGCPDADDTTSTSPWISLRRFSLTPPLSCGSSCLTAGWPCTASDRKYRSALVRSRESTSPPLRLLSCGSMAINNCLASLSPPCFASSMMGLCCRRNTRSELKAAHTSPRLLQSLMQLSSSESTDMRPKTACTPGVVPRHDDWDAPASPSRLWFSCSASRLSMCCSCSLSKKSQLLIRLSSRSRHLRPPRWPST
mmetsp:Transcript_41326/g.117388  ORF Transcript_41326/g.117388 Transcript_41326/m.117388 type:complete len:218 (-) Transcript_41326:709-1362(-)